MRTIIYFIRNMKYFNLFPRKHQPFKVRYEWNNLWIEARDYAKSIRKGM